MIILEAEALVTYTCWLVAEDEQRVREYAKENDCDLNEAINELWDNNEIDVYQGDQTESECCTQELNITEERE